MILYELANYLMRFGGQMSKSPYHLSLFQLAMFVMSELVGTTLSYANSFPSVRRKMDFSRKMDAN